MEELLKYICSSIVENQEALNITYEPESDKVVIVRITVAKEDMGKIIGHNGKVAEAIRTVVKAATTKSGKKYIVKISE